MLTMLDHLKNMLKNLYISFFLFRFAKEYIFTLYSD